MANYLCANSVDAVKEGSGDATPKPSLDIDIRFDEKRFRFTREGDEPLEKALKRLSIKLAESTNSGSRKSKKSKKKGKDQQSQESRAPDSPSLNIVTCEKIAVCGSISVDKALVNGNSLLIGEVTLPVFRDPCRVIHFEAPQKLVSGYPCIPLVVESRSLTAPSKQVQWQWRVLESSESSDSGQKGDPIHREMQFTPSACFEGKTLEVSCEDAIGNVVNRRCTEVLPNEWKSRLMSPLPHVRHPESSSCSLFDQRNSQNGSDAFRVVSYNILHDSYASTDVAREKLYPYVSVSNLDISTRKLRIAKEILDYNASIIAMQEVSRSIFNDYFLPLFQCNNYQGYFEAKSRTETKKGVSSKYALDDGCAIFWDTRHFECIESFSVPLTSEFFSDPLVNSYGVSSEKPWTTIRKTMESSRMIQKSFDRLVMKGIIVHLRQKNSSSKSRELLVANTHLFWHPCAKHIRLLQVHMLLSIVHAMRQKKYPDAEVVVCGDLNSMPDGGVYELLTKGKVASTHGDWDDCIAYNKEKYLANSVDLATLIGLADEFDNDKTFRFNLSGMQLNDSCQHWDDSTFTNFTPPFQARLDYVLHTDKITCVRTLKNPSIEEMSEEIAIPSSKFPSDHVAVVSDLEFV